MKKVELSYSKEFPLTPISYWVGQQMYGWTKQQTPSGQWRRPKWQATPFCSQRKLWCQLEVNFRGIRLLFSTPQELDHFIEIMEQKNLPSGFQLIPGNMRVGRPNRHWLSRLPSKAKPWKFRQAVCSFLKTNPMVKKFRGFYQNQPVQTKFEGFYSNYYEASLQKNKATN